MTNIPSHRPPAPSLIELGSGARLRVDPWPETTTPALTQSPSGKRMVLDAPLVVALVSQLAPNGEETTGIVLRIPAGVWIAGETPLREQRALLVATFCAPYHPPERVERWVQQMLDDDAHL